MLYQKQENKPKKEIWHNGTQILTQQRNRGNPLDDGEGAFEKTAGQQFQRPVNQTEPSQKMHGKAASRR